MDLYRGNVWKSSVTLCTPFTRVIGDIMSLKLGSKQTHMVLCVAETYALHTWPSMTLHASYSENNPDGPGWVELHTNRCHQW